MPDICFYILPSSSLQERDIFTCKLVEKAYRQGVYSVILTASDAHSTHMDDVLWTFRASSFIPHQLYAKNSVVEQDQILISADQSCLPQGSTLINVSQRIPEQLDRFERILEILHQDEQVLQSGRDRYKQYQQTGANLTTHKL